MGGHLLLILSLVSWAACSKVIQEQTKFKSVNDVHDTLVSLIRASNNTNNTSQNGAEEFTRATPGSQYSKEFHQASAFLKDVLRIVKNRKCKDKLLQYAISLDNSTLWAVSMYESTFKSPIGTISGNTYQFGHYDQCVRIRLDDNSRGKYCLADVNFEPVYEKYPQFYRNYIENAFSLEFNPYRSVWEKFMVPVDPSRVVRNKIHVGICIPDSCDRRDVEDILNFAAHTVLLEYDIQSNVTISEESCATNEIKDYSTGAYILNFIILSFIISVIISTTWDMIRSREENEKLNKLEMLMESFSAYTNIKKLSRSDTTGDMQLFHGMKTLTMVLIILGHRCAFSYGGPFFNPEFLEERYRKFWDSILLNGTLIVDTFFMIGGYITCFMICKEYEKTKKVNAPLVYISRWLRIVPVYMLVVFFYGHLFEYLGSGPTWQQTVGREAERCRSNWWLNLLFLNNYINVDNMCMFQSWYVACDFHYTILAPLLISALLRKPSRGLFWLKCILAATVIVPFVITYINQYDGVLRVYVSLFQDIQRNEYFNQFYIKSHNRAFAYFLGIAAAYLHINLKKSDKKPTKALRSVLIVLATLGAFGSIMGAHMFYIPEREYDVLENALYSSLHRVGWAMSMAMIPVVGDTLTFGIVQPVLTSSFYIPFSRLCYSAFLVHGAVQMYTRSIVRTPEYMNFPKMYWMASGDVVATFLIALLVHLIFEAPIAGLQKLFIVPLLTKGSKKKISSKQTLDTIPEHKHPTGEVQKEDENELNTD